MEAQAYALLRVPCAEVQRRSKKGTNGFLYREQSVVHTLYRAIKEGVKRLVQVPSAWYSVLANGRKCQRQREKGRRVWPSEDRPPDPALNRQSVKRLVKTGSCA